MKRARRSLATRRHAVYELAPGLLLVFKPSGHREEEHSHAQRQRLRILSGRLALRIGSTRVILTAKSAPFIVPMARPHATDALRATWLVAEKIGHTAARRRAPNLRPSRR